MAGKKNNMVKLSPANGTQVTGQIYYLQNILFLGTQVTCSRTALARIGHLDLGIMNRVYY